MKRTNDLLVGTVVLLVILTLTGATFWAKQTDIGDRRSKVVARFRDVGNARVGNAVVIRGVRAGTIEACPAAIRSRRLLLGWVDFAWKTKNPADLSVGRVENFSLS